MLLHVKRWSGPFGPFDRGTRSGKSGSTEFLRSLPEERIIVNAADLPVKPFYQLPDSRQVDQQVEKLFTFETEIGRLSLEARGRVNGSTDFSFPIGEVDQSFTLVLELSRVEFDTCRGSLKIDAATAQISLRYSW